MSWIIDEIRARGGEVPFDAYMEIALYHPRHGYYSADTPRFGRSADYVTAPTASEWYPRIVARLVRGLAAAAGVLRLIDLAAGDGTFLRRVTEALGGEARSVVDTMVAVERSRSMRRRIAEGAAGDALAVVSEPAEIPPARSPTVIHASELFDAQPVARVVGRGGRLQELWVTAGGERLTWSERQPRPEVVAYFEDHNVRLEDGQIAEANLTARALHLEILRAAGTGGVALILDYGYESARLYDPRGRRGGSLATYRQHRVGRDPLQSPGEADLTAHVNWDDLRSAGKAAGWVEIGLWPLAEFLVRAGLADELEELGLGPEAEINSKTYASRQEIKRLLDPEGMGSDLKVLVQAKGRMVAIASRLLAMA